MKIATVASRNTEKQNRLRNHSFIINWRKPLAKLLFLNEKRRKLKEATSENTQRARQG
jgi:hypothetical protein